MPRAMATRGAKRTAAAGAASVVGVVEVAAHWRVDAASLRRGGHWEHAGEDATLTVSLVITDGAALAEATISAGDRARSVPLPKALAAPACVITDRDGLLHIDAAPALTATLEAPPGARAGRARALYAATEVLARLGLPGGRYELAGGSLRR